MLELDKTNFEQEVLNESNAVFVDFYGEGCVPCQILMPFVHQIAEKYSSNIKFCALNTTKARRVAISQKVLGLPVMAIYQNGQKVKELIKEECTEENIEALIKEFI